MNRRFPTELVRKGKNSKKFFNLDQNILTYSPSLIIPPFKGKGKNTGTGGVDTFLILFII
jgi:hypothetical protein